MKRRENALEPFPFRLNRNGGSTLLFDAFSSREPVSTSLENALMPLVFRRRRRIFRNREVLMPGGSDLLGRRGLVGIFRGCAGRCPRVGAVGYQQQPGNNGERRYRGNKQFAHCSLHLIETSQTEQLGRKGLTEKTLDRERFGPRKIRIGVSY